MTYTINEIYASAWENAIKNVGAVLHMNEKESMDKWSFVQEAATKLNIRFDLNGEIINDANIAKPWCRTAMKIEITDGSRHFVRTVCKDSFGHLCFKDGGKYQYIFRKSNGIYNSPWYTRVDFIMEG